MPGHPSLWHSAVTAVAIAVLAAAVTPASAAPKPAAELKKAHPLRRPPPERQAASGPAPWLERLASAALRP